MKINTISPQENKYLQIIKTIANCPKTLYFCGDIPEKRIPSVAIVGTRRPTAYGKEVTYKLASELAMKGIVIVSGLAFGVDSIAHKAALDAHGITIAVLANGLDSIYPAAHKDLAQSIIRGRGALISEYPPDIQARGYQFLERNRIVSGLADTIIITEAASRSGTLSTAAHALGQGKDIFVVPGNITSPLSSGCNALIKQGAQPIVSTDDILSVIVPEYAKLLPDQPLGNTPLESSIISLLASGIRDGDEIQQKSGAGISEFSVALTMMEINGTIRALGGNQWTLK